MALVFRPARADELQQAEELVVRSINDLIERHGFGPMATLRPPDFQLFCLKDDPDGLWVAEADGEIVGFALSWVCGDLWFLAELFVAPGHQGCGIGNELLARTFEHARKAGATNESLITFTFNRVARIVYSARPVSAAANLFPQRRKGRTDEPPARRDASLHANRTDILAS